MEDKNFVACPLSGIDSIALFCVFDGHAGLGCSTALVDVFPTTLANHKLLQDIVKQDLSDQELAALWDQLYLEVDQKLKAFEDEGSTGTTVLIWKSPITGQRYVQCANVGDSTAFLCRQGKAVWLSEDHKVTNPLERTRITKMGIQLEEHQTRLNGLSVSRAFGDQFPKQMACGIVVNPYVSQKFILGPKDTRIIIASDGLWDVVQPQKAFDVIKKIKDTKEAATKLVRIAISDTRCHDNITVIVINLK